MSPAEFAFVFAVVAAASALQGGIGFGMNLTAAPLVALIEPRLIPGPLLLAAVLLTILVAARDRADVDWPGFGWVMIGRLPGTALGAAVLASISPRGVAIGVALAVILAVILNLVDLGLRPVRPALLGAGVVSGFAGTISSIGGPPLAVVYANERGPVIRGTLSAIFVVGGALSLASLAFVGRLGMPEWKMAAGLAPAVLVGFAVSRPLATHLDAGRTRAAILSVSAIGAIAVVAAQLA